MTSTDMAAEWFDGRTAAIIGGGAGIGRALALDLSSRGARVFIGDLDGAAAEAVTAEIIAGGGQAQARVCDLGDDLSVAAFADAAFAFAPVDLLFNHAGASVGGLPEAIGSEEWNWLLNINVTGMARSIAAFLPRMRSGGWIVNTSSGLGLFHDLPVAAPYIATKAAIIAYSRALAVAVRGRGIGVSVFCPDMTVTDFAKSGRRRGLTVGWPGPPPPIERAQTPEYAATLALDGVAKGAFLLSAVPHTAEKLRAMADGLLEPGTDMIQADGRGLAISQHISFDLPADQAEEGIEIARRYIAESRRLSECRSCQLSRDLDAPDRFHIVQLWADRVALDAHMLTPSTIDFQHHMLTLGANRIEVRRC